MANYGGSGNLVVVSVRSAAEYSESVRGEEQCSCLVPVPHSATSNFGSVDRISVGNHTVSPSKEWLRDDHPPAYVEGHGPRTARCKPCHIDWGSGVDGSCNGSPVAASCPVLVGEYTQEKTVELWDRSGECSIGQHESVTRPTTGELDSTPPLLEQVVAPTSCVVGSAVGRPHGSGATVSLLQCEMHSLNHESSPRELFTVNNLYTPQGSLADRSETVSVLTCTAAGVFDMAQFSMLCTPVSHLSGCLSFDDVEQERQQGTAYRPSPVSPGRNQTKPPYTQMVESLPNFYEVEHNKEGGRRRWWVTSFFFGAMILPFVVHGLFLWINNTPHIRVKLCNAGYCNCTIAEATTFSITFGQHVYVPFALFTPMLFFFTLAAVERKAEEMRRYVRMSRYTVSGSSTIAPDNDNCLRSSEVLDNATHRALQWDLPHSLVMTCSFPSLWVIVMLRYFLFAIADTQLPRLSGLPVEALGLLQAIGLALPLGAYAMIKSAPLLIVPYALLDAFPLFIFPLLSNIGTETATRYVVLLLFIVMAERGCWYLSSAVMPRVTPVGVKITLSSTFVALSLLAAYVASSTVSTVGVVLAPIVVALEVLIMELVFSTLLVEVTAWNLHRLFVAHILRREPPPPQQSASDATNISTQVRWTALFPSILATVPLFCSWQWDRVLPSGTCDGRLPTNVRFYFTMLSIFVGAFTLACVITIVIRWKNERLRPPLIVKDWVLFILWGWYVSCSVPYALNVVSH
ncbi:hypothetical protein ERJ75_000378400 [Trypanosoma vivax]|uniref:Transmembrane protein n=1 Tax=Trypanosoma vivax (strain Y486) TaxID=1055687 RepID=G0TRU1_TRYVY|nr:hypothetical protein ERJ75_000378400 [Trypanosoma vivax]CCC46663.1 conserved hypothetical protein [Trypanosoma vivax Y486]